ncbi:CdaR family transcriptional regulator [Geodermatophilus sp. DSM 44513]|uniref:PucR family transcriptional regulator n=1 Tax=Geodermatophilus sp. DSM 44513 TaxID=1528104 RepID=UPI001270C1E4|nr:PucR family transcriptional regulator [Geodermatophilus sp. DSM 44513]WNV76074.1 helix-turn-helix domain-containing protein [Geodermatophilus sp. DSM 44513]
MQRFSPEVAARLGEFAPHLLGRVDAMADRVLEVLLRTEPAYRELTAADAAELGRSARAGLARGVHSLTGASSARPGMLRARARDVGARRARCGVPLEVVLRAYRLGGQVLWETLLSVARDRAAGHDTWLLEVAGSVWRTNDAECAAVADGYRDEQRRLAAADGAARQRVLDGLLDGRGGDPAFVRDASELLGVPLAGPLLAAVAPPDRNGEPTLPQPGPALARRGVRSVWGSRSGAQVGVILTGARPRAEVLDWLAALATGPVGVSDVVEGASAAAGAYRLAETAARTLPSGDCRVVTIDDRLPEALLTNSPEISSRLVDRSLGQVLELPPDEREVLLDTLAAFLAADGSPTRAADGLYCHRNTVMHRLRRIEALTGHEVTDPRARLMWQLALLGQAARRPARHPV